MDAWDRYRLLCLSSGSVSMAPELSAALMEEVQDRLGLVEEHLAELSRLLRHRTCTAAQMCHRARCGVAAEEREARRLMEEDAALQPDQLFAASVMDTALHRLADVEERDGRLQIYDEYHTSLLSRLVPCAEEVDRLRVTWEALDSLALRACQYRLEMARLRNAGVVNHSSPPDTATCSHCGTCREGVERAIPITAQLGNVAHLVEQEAGERLLISEARRRYVAMALPVWSRQRTQLLPQCS